MERKRRRRRPWWGNLLSIALGIVIGLMAGLGHMHSVERHQQAAGSLPSEPDPLVLVTREPEETPEPSPEPYNDPSIPDEIEAAARAAGEAYDFEPEFLESIAFYESTWSPLAVNGGCYGLMQISTRWHYDRMDRLGVTEAQIWEAGPNMMVAADYLRELFDQNPDFYWVMMTYNGDSRADAYLRGESGPSEYALLVQELTFELRSKHGKL